MECRNSKGKGSSEESETRFGTTYLVVEWFLKEIQDLQRFVSLKNTHDAISTLLN